MTSRRSRHDVVVLGGLLAVTLAVLWPVVHNDFVNFDDDLYVTRNDYVRRGLTVEGLRWALGSTGIAFWRPLTWMSHMLDVELFGLQAWGPHVVNLLLHACATGLLFLVLRAMTGAAGRSGVVALLFALHPLHVEPVAWIAERKELLGALFWMLTTAAYVRYARRPGRRRFLPVVILFALGLTSKAMIITLPFAFLLLDWWPLGRLRATRPLDWSSSLRAARGLLAEKAPLFVLVVASAIVTYVTEEEIGAIASRSDLPVWARLAYLPVVYAGYLRKALVPTDLAAFYPHPGLPLDRAEVVPGIMLVALVTAACVVLWRKLPCLAVGWFWYLGTLIPVAGLVQFGSHFMADRYSYLPLIGPFVVVTWAASDATRERPRARVLTIGLAAGLLVWFTWLARQQATVWRNSRTLFAHALVVTRDNWFAHNNLGAALLSEGRPGEAREHFLEALRIRPGYAEARVNLGVVLASGGETQEAIREFSRALELDPGNAKAHYNLGVAFSSRGDEAAAAREFSLAIRHAPAYTDAHFNLGNSFLRQGKPRSAAEEYRAALRLRPEFPQARACLEEALRLAGR